MVAAVRVERNRRIPPEAVKRTGRHAIPGGCPGRVRRGLEPGADSDRGVHLSGEGAELRVASARRDEAVALGCRGHRLGSAALDRWLWRAWARVDPVALGYPVNVTVAFTDNNLVKAIYISEDSRNKIIAGSLAIVKSKGNYEVVVAKVAEKINQRDEQTVIVLFEGKTDMAEDDEYKGYEIPDDLMW